MKWITVQGHFFNSLKIPVFETGRKLNVSEAANRGLKTVPGDVDVFRSDPNL